MKSPAELRIKLKRQWENNACREARLMAIAGAWPVSLWIGKPTSSKIKNQLDELKRHVEAWRKVTIGDVLWDQVYSRHTSQPIDVPLVWRLNKPTEWIDAIADKQVRAEFEALSKLVQHSHEIFRTLLVRKRSLWNSKPMDEVILAAKVAMSLEPGCARGQPLRTLSIAGIDTKFFERHERLILEFLDARFERQPSELGLETFLGAPLDAEHWLLVVDLDQGLLPYEKMRVKSTDLIKRSLPGKRLLVVENESSQHQLCHLPQTLAVLGCGFDLTWMQAPWLKEKQVGYWGDIDTWGLQFLAKARLAVPHLDPLMMDAETLDQHQSSAVCEPIRADSIVPEGLNLAESKLFQRLFIEQRGRLEQEFLPRELVHLKLKRWCGLW